MFRLDNHKAPDEWGIKAEILKHGGTVLAMELHQLILRYGTLNAFPMIGDGLFLLPYPKQGTRHWLEIVEEFVIRPMLRRLQNWEESTLVRCNMVSNHELAVQMPYHLTMRHRPLHGKEYEFVPLFHWHR
jgi:hypothetical protein